MDLLTTKLTPAQEHLLTLVRDHHDQHGTWPTWLWLRKHLGLASASIDVLRTLPYDGERFGLYGITYSLAWIAGAQSTVPYPDHMFVPDDARVGLTVAGRARCGDTNAVDAFLQILARAVTTSLDYMPAPGDVTPPPFTGTDVPAPGGHPTWTYEDLHQEPPFYDGASGSAHNPVTGTWSFTIHDRIERYAANDTPTYLTTISDHLAEIANTNRPTFGPPEPEPAPAPTTRWTTLRTKMGTARLAIAGAAAAAVYSAIEDGTRHGLTTAARHVMRALGL